MSNAIRVEVTVTPLVFDGFSDGEYQKADLTSIQIRQTVTRVSYYPSKRVSNELRGSLFSAKECGFGEQSFESTEDRVAWSDAPAGCTEEMAKKAVAHANTVGACIYRVLSHAPIISEDQWFYINKDAGKPGAKTEGHYANQQAMRYPAGHKQEGKLIILDGKVIYRKTFFWEAPKADMDLRGGKYYLSPELQAELAADETPFSGITLKGDEPTEGGNTHIPF